MHACAYACRVRDAKAYLVWAASAGGGEAGDGGSRCGSAPKDARRRAATAGGDGRKRRVTCVGRSGQLEHTRLPIATLTSALRRRCGSLCGCRDAASVRTRARDDVDARPMQRGGSQSELVSVSKRYDACTCTPHVHTRRKSAPRSRRLCRPRRRWWRRQRW